MGNHSYQWEIIHIMGYHEMHECSSRQRQQSVDLPETTAQSTGGMKAAFDAGHNGKISFDPNHVSNAPSSWHRKYQCVLELKEMDKLVRHDECVADSFLLLGGAWQPKED